MAKILCSLHLRAPDMVVESTCDGTYGVSDVAILLQIRRRHIERHEHPTHQVR
jgi:hypothetical protein